MVNNEGEKTLKNCDAKENWQKIKMCDWTKDIDQLLCLLLLLPAKINKILCATKRQRRSKYCRLFDHLLKIGLYKKKILRNFASTLKEEREKIEISINKRSQLRIFRWLQVVKSINHMILSIDCL